MAYRFFTLCCNFSKMFEEWLDPCLLSVLKTHQTGTIVFNDTLSTSAGNLGKAQKYFSARFFYIAINMHLMLVNTTLSIMAHLQRLYSEWLDQDVRW